EQTATRNEMLQVVEHAALPAPVQSALLQRTSDYQLDSRVSTLTGPGPAAGTLPPPPIQATLSGLRNTAKRHATTAFARAYLLVSLAPIGALAAALLLGWAPRSGADRTIADRTIAHRAQTTTSPGQGL